MSIHLNIVGETARDIHATLKGLLEGWAPGITASAPVVPPASTKDEVIEPTDIVPPAATRKPRGSKKAEPVTDINTDGDAVDAAFAATEVVPAEAAPQPTLEDVREAIKELAKATDENTVYALLGKLGAGIKNASTAHAAGKGRELIDEAKKLIAAKVSA